MRNRVFMRKTQRTHGLADVGGGQESSIAIVALFLFGGKPGMAHEGLPKGRRIRLLEEDAELLDRIVPAIDMISPQYRKNVTLTYTLITAFVQKRCGGVPYRVV
jgi:hypothetical protein